MQKQMLRLRLTHDAVRYLKKRDTKQFGQIITSLAELLVDPRPADSESLGDKIHFRRDAGEFRICYSFNDRELLVAVIGGRNDGDVYKQFDRKK